MGCGGSGGHLAPSSPARPFNLVPSQRHPRISPMNYESDPVPPPAPLAIRERVSMPGIFLAVIGVINVLVALYLLVEGMQLSRYSPDEFEKQMEQQLTTAEQKKQWQELKQMGWTAEKILSVGSTVSYIWGGTALVCGLVS